MANLSIRLVVQEVTDHGNHKEVVLRPAVAADSPHGTENASLYVDPPSNEEFRLRFKAGAGNPFVKNSQVVATFAAG